MADFFTITDWIIRALEVFIILYLLVIFKSHRSSLFFGGTKNLKTIDDHELHSCFLSALTVMVFHFISSNLSQYIITIDSLNKMEVRQFFYFTMFICSISFIAALYSLHAIRGCSFSPTARNCLYLALVMALLQSIQLVTRGIYGSDLLSPLYKYGVVFLNVFTLSIISAYPLKNILNTMNKRKFIK